LKKKHEKTGPVCKGKRNSSINYVFLQVRNMSRKLRSAKALNKEGMKDGVSINVKYIFLVE
jgi:hypothetical protein